MKNFEDTFVQGTLFPVNEIEVPTVGVEVAPVTDRLRPNQSHTHFAVPMEQWTWRELRDYVVDEIENRFGIFTRDPLKEAGIFKGFVKRWGQNAGAIARYAFTVCDGLWHDSPVTVFRFAQGSDAHFASIIAESLAITQD